MDWLKRLTGKWKPERESKLATVSSSPTPLPPEEILDFDEEQEEPEVLEFMEIGGSPIPGLTLRRILRGHTNKINRIAWSPDGRFLASPSEDKTIRIWDVARGECAAVLEGHEDAVHSVAWSPDGRNLASTSSDKTVKLWDVDSNKAIRSIKEHHDWTWTVVWSPDGRLLASSAKDKTARIWDVKSAQISDQIEANAWSFNDVAWSQDGSTLATAGDSGSIRLYDRFAKKVARTLRGHLKNVISLAWSPLDGAQQLASAAADSTIRIWNAATGSQVLTIERHTGEVSCVAFSADGQLLASKSDQDETCRLWKCDTWEQIVEFNEKGTGASSRAPGLAFHPRLQVLATLGETQTVIRIWDIDMDTLLGQIAADAVRYTTAKLVLVGDSGVGKTGLGWRLAHGEFKEHSSTHGQQFWVVDDLCTTRPDGTECEVVLWDLAGQHIYRPIHAIFLDNVEASLVLFDPTNRQEPLKGAEFWLEQLAHKKKLPPSVLVGARLDRGGAVLSQEELAQFCQKHGISGGYIGTSAKESLGLDDLLEILKRLIPWDQMTTTVTTRTFKRVKEYVLSLKEKPDRKGVLVSPAELRQQLKASDLNWEFSDAEMMTAVGHLQTHGYVSILRSSSGQEHILLTPELLVDLASSIVMQADKHPHELGALNETDLLGGRYALPELSDLETEEQQILQDAAVVRFLERNICFRETLGNDNLLIFPSLIKQKRPLKDDVEAVDDISYIVRGRVENIYPALVVLLGFTRTFTRVNQWQRQAQYEMGEGNICGFRLIEDVEGEIELVLYYSIIMPDYGRHKFHGLFEEFLYQRDVEVTRFPPVLCSEGHFQERSTVVKRLREGKPFLFCEECGQKIDLPDIEKQPSADTPVAGWIQREEALVRLRSTYEAHLTRIKGFRRDRTAPRCYISRLPAQSDWANKLTEDLLNAGVQVISKRKNVADDDLILIAEAPAYKRDFKRKTGPIAADADLIRSRLELGKKSTIIHLVVKSEEEQPVLSDIQPGDFRRDSYYAVALFDLVLTLYAIPHNHPAFSPLRKALHRHWEETLDQLPEEEEPSAKPVKIFISYAHEDEPFKDKLVKILTGLKRQGIIDIWHDRRVEAGDEWYLAIQEAMNSCDLALLLISDDFIDSRFIHEEEIPKLLRLRQEKGMRVIPIIIRPCLWSSEPVLKYLQALPKDGKAVITFPKETGERDQVWTDIAKVVERQAKAFRFDI